jgi:phosphoribosyl-dephospho-CoA transferase
MQTITDRTEALSRELAIRTRVAISDLVHAVTERAREQRGQTAAEYMGILLVVAVIIGALIASNVDGEIADAAKTMVGKIAGGNEQR